METRKLGRNGPSVSAVGLGCMGTSNLYGPADEVESTATIAAAIEAGILRQPAGRPVFKVDSDEWAVTDGLFPTNGR